MRPGIARLVALLGAALLPSAPALAVVDDPHAALDTILRDAVRDGAVDYLAVRDRHWEALESYLDSLAEQDPAALSYGASLAFHLNLYNATVLHAVASRFRSGYTVAESDWGVFDEPMVRLAGDAVSLNQLEHEIIRPSFGDPRIHVALVCAARSCPPISPRAYRAGDLEEVLESRMARFINGGVRNEIDAKARIARLSRIFDWYAEDFGGPEGVRRYVGRYAGADLSGWQVEFLEYSWDLNLADPADGRYVRIVVDRVDLGSAPDASDAGSVARGEVFRVTDERAGWLRIERPFGAGAAWLPALATAPFRR